MGRAAKRITMNHGILIGTAGLALLMGGMGFEVGSQDDPPPPPPSLAQDGERLGPEGSGLRDGLSGRRGRGRRMGRNVATQFEPGMHNLAIEVKRNEESKAAEVLVDGKLVTGRDAAFLIGFLNRQKNRAAGITETASVPAPSPEKILTVLAVVMDFDPILYANLLELQLKEDQHEFLAKIQRLAFEYAREIALKEEDEEAYQLRVEDRGLERQLREMQFEVGMSQPTVETEIAGYRENMRVLLNARFDIQHKLRGRDIERMKSRIDWVETEYQKRGERQSEIIEDQLDDIFEELIVSGS